MHTTSIRVKLKVALFNRYHKIGDTIHVRLDSGEIIECVVKAEASTISGQPVIWVHELRSCYLLDRVVESRQFTREEVMQVLSPIIRDHYLQEAGINIDKIKKIGRFDFKHNGDKNAIKQILKLLNNH